MEHRDKPIVLLVDDNEPTCTLVTAILHKDYGVDAASDGVEAIEKLRTKVYGAVILDLLMPRVNGFETIPKLRTKHPKVKIVAYTAVAGEFVRQEMARLGIPLVLKSGAFGRLDAVLTELGATDS